LAATASLVHPIPEYSLVHKSLALNQDQTKEIISMTTNALRIFEFDPKTILTNQGISQEEIDQNFSKMSFDYKLYDILSGYVEGVYRAFGMEQFE
jgi:hypothetical protein